MSTQSKAKSPCNELVSILRERTYSRLAGGMHSNFNAGDFTSCDLLREKLNTVFHDALGACFHGFTDLRKQVICAVLSSPEIPSAANPTLIKNLCVTSETKLLELRFKCSPDKMHEFLSCLTDERLLHFQYDCLDAWLDSDSNNSSFLTFGASSVINSLPWEIGSVPSWMARFSKDSDN